MTSLFRLTIPGDPVPKGRPKFAVIGGHGRAYTPKKTRDYEDIIRTQARLDGVEPLDPDMPVVCEIKAYLKYPQSLPARIRKAIEAGDDSVPVVKKPDLDNLIKAAIDSLEGIAWRDQQIVELRASKHYSAQPRLIITAWEYKPLTSRLCRHCNGDGCGECGRQGIEFIERTEKCL